VDNGLSEKVLQSASTSPHTRERELKLNKSVVSIADPMRNVSWMLFPGGMEFGTQVKTGSLADRTCSQ